MRRCHDAHAPQEGALGWASSTDIALVLSLASTRRRHEKLSQRPSLSRPLWSTVMIRGRLRYQIPLRSNSATRYFPARLFSTALETEWRPRRPFFLLSSPAAVRSMRFGPSQSHSTYSEFRRSSSSTIHTAVRRALQLMVLFTLISTNTKSISPLSTHEAASASPTMKHR